MATAGGIENVERFAESWVKLGLHPYIASCYYVRRLNNLPLMFIEYLAAGSLQNWIENRQLYRGSVKVSLKHILSIAIQLTKGLHYATNRD